VDENNNVNANGNAIQNVATPTNGTDAVNKTYVDGLVTGSDKWDLVGSDLFPKQTTYNIGLGTSSPAGFKLNVNGTSKFSGQMDLSSFKIVNVVDPTAAQDAATKNYVDNNDEWTLDGLSLYPKNTSYNVGLGNTAPGAYRLNVTGNSFFSGNLLVSQGNATGGGIILADDGDIVDMNDGFATHRFSFGLRITNGNSSGSTVIQLANGIAGSGNTYFNSANNFGIGNNNPTEKFHVTGTTRLEGQTNITSGNLTVSSLGGAGTRNVSANASGTLVTSNANSDYIISANLRHSNDDWCTGCSNTNGNVFPDGSDDTRHVANLGFNVEINGVSYSQVTICTNGWIAFGDVNSVAWSNTTLPTGTFSGPVIFPYWDDLRDFGGGEFVRYGTVGSAGNRVFMSDWDMRTIAGSGRVNFQVMIHEGSGLIMVQYENVMHPESNGQSATVGFQVSSSKGYPIVTNGKIFDDNEPSQMSWSVCPVR